MEAISTARLRLVPLCIEDAPTIQLTFPQWEIVRWMDGAVPWPYPQDGAERYLKQLALPAMEAGKAWHWSIRPKEQIDLLIGVVSLMDQPDDHRGFWLSSAWRGRGPRQTPRSEGGR
jgi:RimJ/RimL family protein N-acetyltransferase